ncbi:lysylphosphatidylglycerol synthase domain-containing protein [Occultella aeris]|uniref:Uncharacterized protein n=1 Tax=Occultella aeris TaxID=2761496 RepID=A0A7M4DL23_9MICO|nr:lysylphosphatidylglycerol synthase domain-containing protein [Occultella aeris]VZO37913.1 hypothetical protein HALOF300_02838 [Occultella aeris]
MINKLLGVLRSPITRWVFLAVALGAAVLAVATQWDAVSAAVAQIRPGTLLLCLLISVVYVVATMLSWRAVLTDLGSPVRIRTASSIFFLSQLGKYVPGGVWNIVAAAELGADAEIPRRRSLSVMVVSILVSIVTGLALAVVGIVLSPAEVAQQFWWVALAVPVFLVMLIPPVLNRILTFALRMLKRPPLEHPISGGGVVRSSAWALVGWLLAGLQVWLIATAVGMTASAQTFALAAGGYALAWVVGFLVVFVPAGVGAREVVLGAVLYGQLAPGGVLATVLVSRVLLTVVDVLFGVVVLVLRRRSVSRAVDR